MDAFTKLLQEQEKQIQRGREIGQTMLSNRIDRANTLAQIEDRSVKGLEIAGLKNKLDDLDKDYELFEIQQNALSQADQSGYLADLARAVLDEDADKMDELQAQWQRILAKLDDKKREYLEIIVEARLVYTDGKRLSREISAARDVLPKGQPVKWVAGIGENININMLKGNIFFDNQIIQNKFKGA